MFCEAARSNRNTNQALCFGCHSSTLVRNGNKLEELGSPWVVWCLSDLWQVEIYYCNSYSKYRFIDILLHFWGTCHPCTIDKGEHPTINIGHRHFKVLRASWEPCAIMYSESISLVVDYLCGDLWSQKQGVAVRSCYYTRSNKNLTFSNSVVPFLICCIVKSKRPAPEICALSGGKKKHWESRFSVSPCFWPLILKKPAVESNLGYCPSHVWGFSSWGRGMNGGLWSVASTLSVRF